MMQNSAQARQSVLNWYDQQGRDLPWRVKGGLQDPYKVWLSEIMLQQTTVTAVMPYYLKFITLWPDVIALADAEDDAVMQAWAGLGYYSRARNLLKCARILRDDYHGRFPDTVQALKSLPGIGDYTAAAIAGIAFNRHAVVVDGNIERIAARVFNLHTPMPRLKAEVKDAMADIMHIEDDRQSDFVQALMDIGAMLCTPKSPKCMICPLLLSCTAEEKEALPVRPKKQAKPHRRGRVFIIRDAQGRVAVEKRSEKIMLGGMWGLPSTRWHDKHAPDHSDMDVYDLTPTGRLVRHVFTHFSLDLELVEAKSRKKWRYTKPEEIEFPSLYHKVIKLI